jgi:hypothetical protein
LHDGIDLPDRLAVKTGHPTKIQLDHLSRFHAAGGRFFCADYKA